LQATLLNQSQCQLRQSIVLHHAIDKEQTEARITLAQRDRDLRGRANS
jgi:hypothetical protein